MFSKNNGNKRNPAVQKGRPGRDEIVALSLACMHEDAEKLAEQVRQRRVAMGYFPPNRGYSGKS